MARVVTQRFRGKLKRNPDGEVDLEVYEDSIIDIGSEEVEFSNDTILKKLTEINSYNSTELELAKRSLFKEEKEREVTINRRMVLE